MKRMTPTSWFWIVAAAVLAVALFTTGHVYGQSTGAKAVFEGRPAMAGAQAGTGPMAGPPQGGIGPQSPEDAGGGIGARRQAGITGDVAAGGPAVPRDSGVDRNVNGPAVPRDPGMDRPAGGGLQPQRDRNSGEVVKRDRGQDAGDSTKAAGKAKRGGKRSVERARRGVSGVDS